VGAHDHLLGRFPGVRQGDQAAALEFSDHLAESGKKDKHNIGVGDPVKSDITRRFCGRGNDLSTVSTLATILPEFSD
jgi:hypothetical protein